MPTPPNKATRGRGAQSRPANPYAAVATTPDYEHFDGDPDFLPALGGVSTGAPPTELIADHSESIVTENRSPDVPFRYSVNPYRGCEHGCSYCYARPTHEYLGYSAGIDFETRVLFKPRAAELFRKWLGRRGYRPEAVAFSGVTDCYQPAELRLRLTRGCLEVAAECRQPVLIITKNAMVTRDVDLLGELARHGAVNVAVSVTTLDAELARLMEPRTSTPAARLRAIEQLASAGVPTRVMVAPIIPGLNDSE
ncbi:MAG: radical SAM protein, partial [Planctomycetota bacterium]